MRARLPCAAIAVLSLRSALGSKSPLDIAGTYDQTEIQDCFCWRKDRCHCVKEGCQYVGRFTYQSPNESGHLNITMGATDQTCLNSITPAFQMHVDSAGFVLGGFYLEGSSEKMGFFEQGKITYFDPLALDQVMNIVFIGNVFGFNHNPAGHRAIVLDCDNVTICSENSLGKTTCAFGRPRYSCRDVFAYCSGGKCLHENLELLSPKEDAYFAMFSASALNGTYQLSPHVSSANCPAEQSVYQFGSQLGFGSARTDMHLARVVDTAMAWAGAGKVQFQTQCSGLQRDLELAVAGDFEEAGGTMKLTMFRMLPQHEQGKLAVSKCLYVKSKAAPLYGSPCSNTTIAVLGCLLALGTILLGLESAWMWSIHRRCKRSENSGQCYVEFTPPTLSSGV